MHVTYRPLPDSSKILHFEADPLYSYTQVPRLEVLQLKNIEFYNLRCAVHYGGSWTTQEFTALALRGLGATRAQIKHFVRGRDNGGDIATLYNAYCLMGTAQGISRAGEQAVRLAFKRGFLDPDPQAEPKFLQFMTHLSSSQQCDFHSIVPLLGEGMTNKEIGEMTNRAEGTIKNWLADLHDGLGLSNPELVMVMGGLGGFPKDPEPVTALEVDAA